MIKEMSTIYECQILGELGTLDGQADAESVCGVCKGPAVQRGHHRRAIRIAFGRRRRHRRVARADLAAGAGV